MKLFLLTILLLTAQGVFAEGLGEKFCQETATTYFQGYHQRVLDEIGTIQGYMEDVSIEYKQTINDIDQRDETYHFSVLAENDEGDWWVWAYVLPVEAWLAAGGEAHTCNLGEITFLGVTDQSSD